MKNKKTIKLIVLLFVVILSLSLVIEMKRTTTFGTLLNELTEGEEIIEVRIIRTVPNEEKRMELTEKTDLNNFFSELSKMKLKGTLSYVNTEITYVVFFNTDKKVFHFRTDDNNIIWVQGSRQYRIVGENTFFKMMELHNNKWEINPYE